MHTTVFGWALQPADTAQTHNKHFERAAARLAAQLTAQLAALYLAATLAAVLTAKLAAPLKGPLASQNNKIYMFI